VTTTRRKVQPKAEAKSTAATKRAAVKPKRAANTGTKPAAAAALPVADPGNITSPIEGKSDHFDTLSDDLCVQLTRRLLTPISSLPKEPTLPRAVLKTEALSAN
jgi:hypothetical protein